MCNVIITVRVPTAHVHHHTIMIISLVPGPELMLLLPVVMLEVEVTIRLYLIVLDNFDIDQCTSILQYSKKATSLNKVLPMCESTSRST